MPLWKEETVTTSPNRRSSLLFIALLLFLLPFTLADYNFLPEYGGDPDHSFSVLGGEPASLTAQVMGLDNGTSHHPIVFDFNGDGEYEIIIEDGDSEIQLLSAENPAIKYSSFPFRQAMNGIACDVDDDGDREYVTIINQTGQYDLLALSISANNDLLLT